MQQPEQIKAPEDSLNAPAKWHYSYQSGKSDTKLAPLSGKAKHTWMQVKTKQKPLRG